MKKLILYLGFMLWLGITPTAYASFSVPLIATSSTSTAVFPQWGGTTMFPSMLAPFFTATSTTATSTFAGGIISPCIATSTAGPCITGGGSGGAGTNYFSNSGATTTLSTGTNLAATLGVFGSVQATSSTSTFAKAVGIGTSTPASPLSIQSGILGFGGVGNGARPASPSVALAGLGAGNLSNGTYQYAVEYINPSGYTEASSPASLVVSNASANGQAIVTIPVSADPSVTGRVILRTTVGTYSYYQLAFISNDTATSYTDDISDAQLLNAINAYSDYDSSWGGVNVNGSPFLWTGGTSGPRDASIYLGPGAGNKNATTSVIDDDIAIGGNALGSNITGNLSVALGASALGSDQSGSFNMAIGRAALTSDTSGSENVAVGVDALYGGTGPSTSVGIGTDAGFYSNYYDNTWVGASSGFNMTSGQQNTCIGASSCFGGVSDGSTGSLNVGVGENALNGVTSGSDNVAIGAANAAAAYDQITTGGQNVSIGYDVGVPSQTGNGQLNIQNIIFGTGNTATGTSTAISTGNIGIGTTTPVYSLSVSNGSIIDAEAKPATSTSMNIYFASSTSQSITIGTSPVSVDLMGAITGSVLRFEVCNGNSTAGTLTFVSSTTIHYSGGTMPTQTKTANVCDDWTMDVHSGTSSPIIWIGQIPW